MASFVRLSPDRPSLDAGERVIRADAYATVQTADQVLAAAREEAAATLRAAETEYQSGRERGYADGLAEAQAEFAEQILGLVARSVDFLGQAEGQVSHTVLICLRKILGEFPEEELVARAARAALDQVRGEPRASLRVRPGLVDGLRTRVGEILRGSGDVSFLEVVGDERLEHGGCRLESESGVVDASIEVQLAALEKVFRSRLTPGAGED